MENKWQNVTLGSLFNVKHGFAFKGEYFTDTPSQTVLTTPGNFSIGGGFQAPKPKYYIGPIPHEYILKPGQIVVTMTDLSKESDTLGLAAVIPNDGRTWLHNQRVGLLEFKKDKPSDSRFICYLLRTHEYRSWIMGSATGTTVKHTSPNRIHSYTCNIPCLDEQKKIAHILGSLDDKIELNRQMNATLEAIAQSLFKSWFVDFDPVIDNALAAGNSIPEPLQARAEIRKALGDQRKSLPDNLQQQFPDRFVLTDEMGWIPDGWEIKKIGELLELAYGKSLPAAKRNSGDIPVFGSGGISGFHDEKLVNGPGLIVGRKGTVGSLYWSEDDFFPIDTVFYVVKKTQLPLYWLYQSLQLIDIKSMGADSAVPGVNRNTIYARCILTPSDEILGKYSIYTDSYNSRIKLLEQQNAVLAKIRDTLLPKLLSGELRVPEAEAIIDQQLAEA